MKIIGLLIGSILLLNLNIAHADVAWSTKILGLVVPTGSVSDVVYVAFGNTNGTCPQNRVKISKQDKELYSYILALYMSDKTVSYYFNPTGTLGEIPGHGTVPCELTSIWVDGA